MALTKIMGQNFRAFVNGDAVPEALNCNVTITGNTEDATTCDSTGSYVQEKVVTKDWSVNVDSLDASLESMRAMITRFNSDDLVTVGWDQAGGTLNRVAQNADFALAGPAILNELNIQANNRTNIQVSAQYQGSGALA